MKISLALIAFLTFSQFALALGKSKDPHREFKNNIISLDKNLQLAILNYSSPQKDTSCNFMENASQDVALIYSDLENIKNDSNALEIENVTASLTFSAFYITSAAVSCKSGHAETETHFKLLKSISDLRESLRLDLLSVAK